MNSMRSSTDMSTSMSMISPSKTMTSGGASPTATSSMSMGGMDMGGGMDPHACKISVAGP